MTKRKWAEDDWAMVARLNAVRITKEDLWRIAGEAEKVHKNPPDPFGSMFLVARMFKGEPAKAQAVLFCMEALARLLEERGAPGWTLPKTPDGAIPTQEAVFSAAAVEPLAKVDGELGFEQQAFLRRVLAEAEVKGNG